MNTFLYVNIVSITNVAIMANGKCIGILHKSCIDDNIEISPTIITMKIAILHNDIQLLEISSIPLYEIVLLILLFSFGDIFISNLIILLIIL